MLDSEGPRGTIPRVWSKENARFRNLEKNCFLPHFLRFPKKCGWKVYKGYVELSKMKVKLKFLFPFLLKIKAFWAASFTCSVHISKQKNFGGKQNFPPKSCFPILETKSIKAMSSLEKACLNYRKKSNSNKYINSPNIDSVQSPSNQKQASTPTNILFLFWKLFPLHHLCHPKFGLVYRQKKC